MKREGATWLLTEKYSGWSRSILEDDVEVVGEDGWMDGLLFMNDDKTKEAFSRNLARNCYISACFQS